MTAQDAEHAAAPGTGPVVEMKLPLHEGTMYALLARINPGGTSLTPAEIAHALEQSLADQLREERLDAIIADGRAEHGEPSPERSAEIRGLLAEAGEMWHAEQADREGGSEAWRVPLAG